MEKLMNHVANNADKYVTRISWVVMLAVFVASFVMPQLAFAQAVGGGGGVGNLCTNANQAVKWIEIGVYFILVVAVLGAAVAASFGRMEWMTVGKILIGCIICGVAVPVVTALSGLSGC